MLAISNNPLRVRLVGCVLMLAVITYFAQPLVLAFTSVANHVLADVFQSLVPILTLFFVWSIFEDGRPVPGWIWLLLGLDIAFSFWMASTGHQSSALEAGSQLLKLTVAIIAVLVVWRGRDDDLLEMRTKVRMWFVGALAITVLAVALKELVILYNLGQPRLIGLVWMFILALGGNIAFFRLNPDLRLVWEPVNSTQAVANTDPVIDELMLRMKTERLYTDHDLRVATLAELIAVPEYQLRRKINQTLGFRNFNQFVNHYRIKEAGARLLSEPRTPVLSIAIDVGFRSISSFNTAFQQKFGVSPTAYRAKALSDS
jgi:AraC-like DNA-binding protein